MNNKLKISLYSTFILAMGAGAIAVPFAMTSSTGATQQSQIQSKAANDPSTLTANATTNVSETSANINWRYVAARDANNKKVVEQVEIWIDNDGTGLELKGSVSADTQKYTFNNLSEATSHAVQLRVNIHDAPGTTYKVDFPIFYTIGGSTLTSGATTEITNNSARLNWAYNPAINKNDGLQQEEVQIWLNDGTTNFQIARIPAYYNTYQLNDLVPSTQYTITYKVEEYLGMGSVFEVTGDTFTTTVDSTISNIQVKNVSDVNATITWTYNPGTDSSGTPLNESIYILVGGFKVEPTVLASDESYSLSLDPGNSYDNVVLEFLAADGGKIDYAVPNFWSTQDSSFTFTGLGIITETTAVINWNYIAGNNQSGVFNNNEVRILNGTTLLSTVPASQETFTLSGLTSGLEYTSITLQLVNSGTTTQVPGSPITVPPFWTQNDSAIVVSPITNITGTSATLNWTYTPGINDQGVPSDEILDIYIDDVLQRTVRASDGTFILTDLTPGTNYFNIELRLNQENGGDDTIYQIPDFFTTSQSELSSVDIINVSPTAATLTWSYVKGLDSSGVPQLEYLDVNGVAVNGIPVNAGVQIYNITMLTSGIDYSNVEILLHQFDGSPDIVYAVPDFFTTQSSTIDSVLVSEITETTANLTWNYVPARNEYNEETFEELKIFVNGAYFATESAYQGEFELTGLTTGVKYNISLQVISLVGSSTQNYPAAQFSTSKISDITNVDVLNITSTSASLKWDYLQGNDDSGTPLDETIDIVANGNISVASDIDPTDEIFTTNNLTSGFLYSSLEIVLNAPTASNSKVVAIPEFFALEDSIITVKHVTNIGGKSGTLNWDYTPGTDSSGVVVDENVRIFVNDKVIDTVPASDETYRLHLLELDQAYPNVYIQLLPFDGSELRNYQVEDFSTTDDSSIDNILFSPIEGTTATVTWDYFVGLTDDGIVLTGDLLTITSVDGTINLSGIDPTLKTYDFTDLAYDTTYDLVFTLNSNGLPIVYESNTFKTAVYVKSPNLALIYGLSIGIPVGLVIIGLGSWSWVRRSRKLI